MADPTALLAGDLDRPAARGAGAARAGARERGRHHRLRHRCRPPGGGRRAGRPARGGRPRRGHRRAGAGARRRDRSPPRPHRHAGWRGSTGASSGSPSSTTRRRRGSSRARTTRRCAGGWRSSPPPRRWIASAATGGRRTARRCSPPGSTTRRCSGGGSPTPPTPTGARPRSPTRPPAPRTPTSRPGSCRSTATARRSRWDRDDLPYLAEAAGTTTVRSSPCTRATSGGSRCAAPTRGRARPRRSGRTATTCGWSARPARRPGSPTVASWCAPTPTGAVASSWAARPVTPDDLHVRARRPRRRRPRGVHRQPDRRRHRHLRVALVRRRASSSSPPTTACTRAVVGGDTVVVRRASLDDHAPSGGRGRRTDASPATVATPLVTPNVSIRHVGERRLATALLLPHDAGDDDRLPVLLDPYGGPARAAGRAGARRLPHVAVVRRPGLRGGRHRRPRHAGARRRSGSAASTATWPARCWRTRSTGCSRWPPRTRASTCHGWRSAGGASAATWPRSPCSAGPTSSTPPSPARPVTDWRLYDTFYTERYLGDPVADADRLRRLLAPARRRRSSSARCCSSTAWPTTTS